MNKSIFSFMMICGIALVSNLQAQTEVVSGKISDWKVGNESKILVYSYVGPDSIAVDSTSINANGEFSVKSKSYYPIGEYALILKGGKPAYFVAENVNLKFLGNYLQFTKGMAQMQAGKENLIYNQLIGKYGHLVKVQDSIKKAVERTDQFDEKYTTKTTKLRQAGRDSAKVFNKFIRELQTANPKSFSAEIIGSVLMFAVKDELPQWDTLYDNNLSFMYNKFFMHINFVDNRIVRNRWIFPKIKEYYSNFVKRSEEPMKKAIKKILEPASALSEVKKEVNRMLLKHFIEANNIQIVSWLKKDAFSDCDAPEMSEKDMMLMKRMESVSPGKPAPELEVPNVEGVPTKLSSLKGNKAVVVLFWASWCHHCLEETPKIHTLYKEYKKRGLEVYAVSLDSKQADWADAVKRLGFEWTNVSDLKHWESPAARRFMVKSTPTIYILDSNMIIRKIVSKIEDIKTELNAMGL